MPSIWLRLFLSRRRHRRACPSECKMFCTKYTNPESNPRSQIYTQCRKLSYQYSTTVMGNPWVSTPWMRMQMGTSVSSHRTMPGRVDRVKTLRSSLSFLRAGKSSENSQGIKMKKIQSVRFIGDRLYLVTFQQIDSRSSMSRKISKSSGNWKSLDIPRPPSIYDKDRLIGLGYDTHTNQWGGTQNGWL